MRIIILMLFHEPQPTRRQILDAVSAFYVAIQNSLRAGHLLSEL